MKKKQLLAITRFVWKVTLLPIALLLFFASTITAQKINERTITGTVNDETNKPLPGVSVIIVGQKEGTATDVNGKFTIKTKATKPVLVFSYVGFKSEQIKLSTSNEVAVKLSPSAVSALDDVVVVGYGTTKKKDVTGAVGSVDMKDLIKAPVKSYDEALAGRVAGVQVSSTDGQPGAAVNIVIRGGNSITSDNSPLYVIDGFPIEGYNNNFLNPTDIESIDVLKDASATAIYGARGANGVILITTKKGKIGEPLITYDGWYSVSQNLKTIAVLSPYEFIKLQAEKNQTGTTGLYFQNGKNLESYRNTEGINWFNRILRKAPTFSHSLSISGGSSATKYLFSGNVTDQKGIIINSDYKRYQGRLNLEQKIAKKMKIGVNAAYAYTAQNGTPAATANFYGTTNLLARAWTFRPVSGSDSIDLQDAVYDPAVSQAGNSLVNPVSTAKYEIRKTFNNNFSADLFLEYAITNALKLRIAGGINSTATRNEQFNGVNTSTGSPFSSAANGVNGSVSYANVSGWLNENTLTYTKNFKKHFLNILAGVTEQASRFRTHGFAAKNLPNEFLGISGLEEGVVTSTNAGSSYWALQSYLGRVNYSYNSKYLITANIRADGSSRFAKGNKWGYFPSGSFAWRLINEPFIKRIKFISDAKIRIGYGVTGNNRVGDFAYFSTLFTPLTAGYPFNNIIGVSSTINNNGAYPDVIGNKSLKWESTSQFNAGIDFAFFKNRLSFIFDVYQKDTKDLLLNAQLPLSSGFNSAFKNIGQMRNKGLEFTLNTENVKAKKFSWNSSFNIAFTNSKIVSLVENQNSIQNSVFWENTGFTQTAYISQLGGPISQMYGFVFERLYQIDDFYALSGGSYLLKANVVGNGNAVTNIKPGDIKYKDLNEDGILDGKDQTIIGRAVPLHSGGFSNNCMYKNFDLNIFFQWSYGNDILNANRLIFEGYNSGGYQNFYATVANRWTPTNTNTNIPRTNGNLPSVYSTRVIEDGSYLRLKTISLGYNIDVKRFKKAGLQTLRVYTAAQNIYTWTNYSGLDPEVSVRPGNLTQGFDFAAYPRARVITFGVKAAFK
jgi:TonB-dependent starch-binding outer membrane protein SusC